MSQIVRYVELLSIPLEIRHQREFTVYNISNFILGKLQKFKKEFSTNTLVIILHRIMNTLNAYRIRRSRSPSKRRKHHRKQVVSHRYIRAGSKLDSAFDTR